MYITIVILIFIVISKSKLKAKMLAVFRTIERSGEEVIVTDHGKPTLKISRLPKRESVESVFERYRNRVRYKGDIMLPTAEEWLET